MPFTNDYIKQYGIDKGWVNAQGLVNGSTDQERAANALNIYNDASQWGVGADQLEASFGWNPGTVNSYLAGLDTVSQDDPWAWLGWAQQREPETYAWRDLGRVEDSPAAYQWMLEKAGIWNPDYVSEADIERAIAAGVDPASISAASAGPNPYAGLTMRDARGPGHQRLTQLIDQNGNVIATDNPEAYEGYHEDTWRSVGAIVGGALGGMYLGPAVSGAVGGGTLGAVAGGAATGALTGQIATGDTEGTLRGGVIGGIGGYVGQALNGGTVDPYGPNSGWGQDTLTNMGYSPAEIAAMQSANTIGSGIDYWQNAGNVDPYGPGSGWGQDTLTNMGYSPAEIAAMQQYQSGYDEFGPGNMEDFNQWAANDFMTQYQGGYDEFGPGYNPSQDHLTPAAIDSMFNSPGYGSNAAAEGVSGQESGIGALDPDFRPGYVDPGTGSTGATDSTGSTGYKPQEVSITDTKPPVGTGTGTIPGTNIPPGSGIVPNIPTGQNPPASNIKVPDVPEYRMLNQVAPKSDLEKFWDWVKANPALAMQLFGLGASAFKGGSNNPAPGAGPQAGMTATPAAPLNRRYVAPPAGYRPGFDPEWQYFQPGPAPAGTSTTQPVQGKVGIASVYNTPTFTSGSTIGSPSVNKPYTPGPNNNMTMNGQPLTPTFSSVGAGSPPPANVPQQAAPTYTPEQIALANAYKAHLGFADGAGAGVSTEDALARLANEQRRFDLFGNDSTSLFKNNPALYAAYKAGNAGAFTAALGPQQNNASAAYRYTGDATSAAAGQAELAKLDAQKAAEVAATQPGGPMFGGVGSLPK